MCGRCVDECGGCGGGATGGGDATSLQGAIWESPLGIGTVTPSVGNFTTSTIGTLTNSIANLNLVNVSSLNASQFVATDASKNLISVAGPTGDVPATPSTLVLRDVHADIYANNVSLNTLFVTTTGGTTLLGVSVPNQILLTGVLGQTVKFPNASAAAYTVGTEFRVNNGCTAGVVTIKDNGNVTIGTVPFGGLGVVILTSLAGNGTWEVHALVGAGSTWGSDSLVTPSKITTTNTSAATSTTTGCITAAGGAGILGDVWIGGDLNVAGAFPGGAITTMFWQLSAKKEVGSAFAFSIPTVFSATNPIYQYYWLQSPAAVNDQWSQNFAMNSGAYTLSVLGQIGSNRGIMTVYIDGISQGPMDWYAAVGGPLIINMAVNIPTSGPHIFRVIVATKNGSSTGYSITISQYWIQ